MTWITIDRPDETFLLSEATGFRSRDTVTIAGGRAYAAGTVLELSNEVDHYVPFEGAEKAVVLCRRTDATAGPVEVAVISDDAEVKRNELDVEGAATIDDAVAALAANGIKAR